MKLKRKYYAKKEGTGDFSSIDLYKREVTSKCRINNIVPGDSSNFSVDSFHLFLLFVDI
jgi:hypothetical protein